MSTFIQLFIIGMGTGGFYALNGLGMVVVFRSSGVINFATSGAAMLGGYASWHLADEAGWSQLVALPAALLVGAAANLLVYALVMIGLRESSTLTKVIATIAILVSLQQLVLLTFGGLPKVPRPFLSQRAVRIGAVIIGQDTLTFLAFTTTLSIALWAVYRFTRFGLATSALAEGSRALDGLGWRTGRLRAANWAVGGALAGATGVAVGQFLQLNITNFAVLLVPTLAAAILGGLRSFPVTLAGGLLIGGSQAVAQRYVHLTGVQDAIPFLAILVVMMAFGRTLPLRSYVQERLPRVGSGEVRVGRLLLGVAAAVAFGAFARESWVIGAGASLFLAGLSLSQVVITGYAGQLSLAQLTMSGLGAMAACNASVHLGLGFIPSLLVGMLSVIPVGLLLGVPAMRARGASLAIATFGFSVAVSSVVLSVPSLTGGVGGFVITPPSLLGWNIDFYQYPRRYFIVAVGILTLVALVVANIRRGRVGRRMLAVRNNERAAAALGINVAGTKLYAFSVGAAIAGLAGALTAFAQTIPQFTGYGPVTSLFDLLASVLGGIGYVLGPLFGGMFAPSGLPNAVIAPITDNLSWWNAFFPLLTGLLLVVQLWVNPNGVADDVVHGSRFARRRFARKRRDATAEPDGPPTAADAVVVQTDPPPEHPRRGATLRVSDIRVTFGTVTAVDGVSLTVGPGEVVGVIGPNGAGKTTVMDAITGFVRAGGTVELDGEPIHDWPVHRRARAGLVRSFQSLELLEDMTVFDNLRCAAEPQDAASMAIDLIRPGRWAPTPSMTAAISIFGLGDKLDAAPTEIGYGDRRLVAVARAVAAEPAVLLLDEPAAGLSDTERRELTRLIRLMARDWGMAILIIEHDVELIRNAADRVIALDFGREIASGTPEEVLGHPAVITAYLGVTEQAAPAGRVAQAPPRDSAPPEKAIQRK